MIASEGRRVVAASAARRRPQAGVQPVRALLADHDALARNMVRRALEDEPDLRLVADATDGEEALQLARFYQPQILIVEAWLPGVDSLDLIREVTRALPDTRTMLLCAHGDEGIAVDALSAGAVGYVTKDVDPAALPDLIRSLAEGNPIVPESLIPRMLERLRETPDAGWRPVRSRLTTREWEMVDLIAEGATTNEIADRLVLSPATVYSHIKSLMRKVDVHSRKEALEAAARLRRHEAGLPMGEV